MATTTVTECQVAPPVVDPVVVLPPEDMKAMEEMRAKLDRSEFTATSDLQGWAAQVQILTPVLLMCLTPQCTAAEEGMRDWWPTVARAAFLVAAGVWHGLLGNVVLSPLPYAVLALQLALQLAPVPAFEWVTPLLVLVATAVSQRSCENLIHEVSHFTLFRSQKLQLRNSIGTFFAHLVFRDTDRYRASHKIHHGSFGDRKIDPDYSIYDMAKVSSWSGVFEAIAFWYQDNACSAARARPLTLAFFVTGALGVLSCAVSPVAAAFLQRLCVVWLQAYFVVLPPLRMVAEQEEHSGLIPEGQGDWARVQWALSRTNDGLLHRWIFHPCGDGYHAVHHLSARVPFFRLREVHQELMKIPAYARGCQLNRVPFRRAFLWL